MPVSAIEIAVGVPIRIPDQVDKARAIIVGKDIVACRLTLIVPLLSKADKRSDGRSSIAAAAMTVRPLPESEQQLAAPAVISGQSSRLGPAQQTPGFRYRFNRRRSLLRSYPGDCTWSADPERP